MYLVISNTDIPLRLVKYWEPFGSVTFC